MLTKCPFTECGKAPVESQYLIMHLNTTQQLIYTSGLNYDCADHLNSDVLALEQLNMQL